MNKPAVIMSNALTNSRAALGQITGSHVTQKMVADIVGISVAGYKLAESHGVARARTRELLIKYLNASPDAVAKRIMAQRRAVIARKRKGV